MNGKENAEITKQILKGELKGAKRDIVLLNSALGIAQAERQRILPRVSVLQKTLIDSGKLMKKLEQFVKATNE